MKALSIILIVVCSFLQALGNTYHYSFSTEDFQINTNKEGDISVDYLKGIAIDNEAGMPDLPLISSDIIIPDEVWGMMRFKHLHALIDRLLDRVVVLI